MAVVAGVLGLVIDGTEYRTEETAKYSVQTKKYESLSNATGRIGRKQLGKVPFVEVGIYLEEGQKAADLNITDATAILRCADRTVTIGEADQVADLDVDSAENKVTLRFEGRTGQEVF